MATTTVLTMVLAWLFAITGTMLSTLLHINRMLHSAMINNIGIDCASA